MNPFLPDLPGHGRRRALRLALAAPLAGLLPALATAASVSPPLRPVPAALTPIAAQSALLGCTWAGPRAVAVGDHGIVLLSDDRGQHWRQARSVPVSFTLTAVSFVDARHGWAVGHGGSILVSSDGGETWRLQRSQLDEDRPLFAVHFFDGRHGVAVGLWSQVLVTEDGGEHWQPQPLAAAPGARKADLNLLSLFADSHGALYATAEQGQVLRSDDRGHTWRYLPTGYKGSLWAGVTLEDGALLVGGQRGTLLRSDDQGHTWTPISLGISSSITAIAANSSGVTVVGLDGLVARSSDGRRFNPAPRPDGLPLTSALPVSGGAVLLFSRRGVLADASRP